MRRMLNNEKYKQCEKCGCLIEKTTSNNKYCSDCASFVKNEKINELKRKKRTMA